MCPLFGFEHTLYDGMHLSRQSDTLTEGRLPIPYLVLKKIKGNGKRAGEGEGREPRKARALTLFKETAPSLTIFHDMRNPRG